MAMHHEDEVVGKAYDHKLMKRLLKYARPYKWFLVGCVLLLLVITGLDLLQPYLIKVAIDNHMNALSLTSASYPPCSLDMNLSAFTKDAASRTSSKLIPVSPRAILVFISPVNKNTS
jgi:ABC-type multidrug transport system fused ATPase/permease subunit